MPRVVVTTEDRPAEVVLDETIAVCHVDDATYSMHFLERLAWAIHDGAEAEGRRAQKLAGRRQRIAETPRPEPIAKRVLQPVR